MSSVIYPDQDESPEVFSGEPLPENPSYPIRYHHVSGHESLCYNRQELERAHQQDSHLFLMPFATMILFGISLGVLWWLSN